MIADVVWTLADFALLATGVVPVVAGRFGGSLVVEILAVDFEDTLHCLLLHVSCCVIAVSLM